MLLGHLLASDSIGPAIGGTTALLALLGGTWFPITGGTMQTIAEALPSYWLVRASQVGIGGAGWGVTGWAVVWPGASPPGSPPGGPTAATPSASPHDGGAETGTMTLWWR